VDEPATMEGELKPGFAREQLAIYDHAIVTKRPFPASFFAPLGSSPRKRSLRSFRYDESMCTAAMKLDYVRRLRERAAEEPMVDESNNGGPAGAGLRSRTAGHI
jgi:hypothetical protein